MIDPMSAPASVTLLGIAELEVLAVFEFADERVVFVQTRDGVRRRA
jgi:hypothetical protein